MINIGDKVVISKRISFEGTKKAIVEFVNIKREFYRVYYYTEGGSKITCNIFYNQSDESIELDIEEIRNDKLKTLGI